MRKIILGLLFINTAMAVCSQSFISKSYKTGIYIFCAKELPKKFSYVIEKKLPDDTAWKAVAELNTPKNEADCRKMMLSLPLSIASFTDIQDGEMKKLWQQIQTAKTLDSLYAFGLDPRFQFVAGCAWLDENIKVPGTYQYRISKIEKHSRAILREESIPYPAKMFGGKLTPVKFKPGEENIRISYAITDSFNTAGIKLYRSKYEEKKFSQIPANVFFTKDNNRMVAQVTDVGVVQGMTYTYVAIPVDALGDEGTPADTLHIYNVIKPSDIGLIQKFDITPKEKERGNQLQWKLKTDKGISSIDVYRSQTYEGTYRKLVSLAPAQSSYFDDKDLAPSKAYYYYILVNNGYGNSLPSARIPAILQGNKQNLFPPQNIKVTRNGRLVKLTFSKLEADTRGYYIYRGNGYAAPLKQLQRMLLSSDSLLTYIDTLPESKVPEVYSYAVADINNSYNISPLSERVSVQASASDLPPPTAIAALYRGNRVFVTWKDITAVNPSVTGYNVYRAITDDDGKETQTPGIIFVSDGVNAFTDVKISEGTRYHYYVQSIGLDATDVSSLSRNASVFIPGQNSLNPGTVTAFAAQNKIIVKWDLPADAGLKAIRIYRAVANQKASLVKELSSTEKQFEDPKIEVNKTYYYYITTISSNNKESKPTDAVSAKLRG